jgi:DNA-binding CsgD family transcriptional regulator/tetratricopeptide (TPR) repeat protein
MTLLEREPLLAQLRDALEESRQGRARLVLISGEAGIGKTALVEAFCAEVADDVDVFWGSCDAVVPARPFAPLVDIADKVDGALREALDSVDRNRVFDAFLTLLRQRRGLPPLVVFDDLHWADEATLDLLRVVGRRIRDLRVLFVGTYRDEEVRSEHPLRIALGDIPSAVLVIDVPALSVDAVEVLTGGGAMDAVVLHAATAGNPFFVTEVVAAGEGKMPVTVRDAVFARLGRLSSPGQQILRAASVLGQACEPALVREVADGDLAAIEECVERGMLQRDSDLLRFRHELAQRAIREGLGPAELVALHAQALAALRRAGVVDPGRLAHHAVEADDAAAVLELAPEAAKRAVALGAHREAAAHYSAALRFASALDERSRAELLEAHAREGLVIDDIDGALASQRQALDCWRRLGDVRAEGNCLCALSLATWDSGDAESAIELAERAVELLESAAAPDAELARAYATLAQRYMVGIRDEVEVLSWSERALELAERVGDEPVAVHALTTLGTTEVYLGRQPGWTKLEEGFRRAQAAGLEEDAARAIINLVEAARDLRRFDLVDRYRQEAIEYVIEQDVDLAFYRRRLESDLAEVDLERGRWQEAAEQATALLEEQRTANVIRLRALIVLGRLVARRGDPDPWPLLDEALALSGPQGEREQLCALHAARVEAAWLEGNATRARAEAKEAAALGVQLSALAGPWWRGELGFWAWRGGALDELPEGSAEPYVLHVAGRYRAAASAWEAIGCPYQQALALADSDDEDDLRRALEIFQSLGARPAASSVVERLRALGVRTIPRGPRPRTQRNPAGLTDRELEVLVLIGQGLRNVDIAERLVVSPKTVDHHVSAILRKLGVPNRVAAAEEAVRLGLEDREIVAPK